MPTKKEELALRWAEKSEEEKNINRKKTAKRVKLYRAEKGVKKRNEMKAAQLFKVRATDKDCKRRKRKEMTEEQRDLVKAKDRERKAKGRKKKADTKIKNISNEINVEKIDKSMYHCFFRMQDFCTLALVFGRKVPVFRNPLW